MIEYHIGFIMLYHMLKHMKAPRDFARRERAAVPRTANLQAESPQTRSCRV